jgi:hypothetical protein
MAGLLLTLGACSQLPQPSLQPSRHSEPMAAQILPRSPGVGLRIRVDRPAYAALYQIIPGAGVSQVYPALGTGNMEGRVFAGYTSMNPVRFANLEDYAPSPQLATGPRFYFLITSDRPLDIDRFGTFGVGLRSELGLQFTGFNPYETMERIADMTIPVPGDEESWSTDLYVEWPDVLFNAPVPGRLLVPLHCGKYRMYVPVDRVLEVDTRVCHPDRIESDAPQAPQQPTDSAAARPRPRAPVPPASKPAAPKPVDQRAASKVVRERIMASTQLDESRADARTPRNRSALQRSPAGRTRAGRESDPSGSNRGVRYSGSRSSSAGVDAASARTVESTSSQASSGARSPQPAASPAPAPAPAPSSPAPAPAPRPTPEVRGESNGG